MSPPLSENCGLCKPLKSIHRKNEYIIKEIPAFKKNTGIKRTGGDGGI